MKRIPELLAPAGGMKQLRAAVNNGADAVYMGGSLFNARMRADNFSRDEFEEAITYAHERGVKVYVTVNTLIKDEELAKAFEYVNYLYGAGADGIIVQDMGLARLVHKYLPDLPMHLSTQGTVYNRHAVGLVKKLGFSRIVPARELTSEELALFTEECHEGKGGYCSVEVFVHGALCMCYSGQCHMSRILGKNNRSGNRGVCAQPCRLAYVNDKGEEGYWLSPKDLCLIDRLPELCEMGVDSLKIEGRLKSAEYVGVVTSIYRKYLDEYALKGEINIDKKDYGHLRQIYSRGEFSHGYFDGNPGSRLLSGDSPKHKGLKIGYVKAVSEIRAGRRKGERRWLAEVEMAKGAGCPEIGDVVEIRSEAGKPVTGNIATYIEKTSKKIIRIGDFKEKPGVGDVAYRMSEDKLNRLVIDNPISRKTLIDMNFTGRLGELPVLEGKCDGKHFIAEGENPCEKAVKKAVDTDFVCEKLCKLGGTVFEAGILNVDIDDGISVPASMINSMRRNLVSKITDARRSTGRKGMSEGEIKDIISRELSEGLQPLYSDISNKVPVENFKGEGVPYISNISKGALDKYIEDNFDSIVNEAKESGIILGNMGWIETFCRAGIKVYGDYGLNVYNRQAQLLFEEEGVEMIGYSHEFEGENIPLMITEHPVLSEWLTDRKGVRHKVIKVSSGDKYMIF